LFSFVPSSLSFFLICFPPLCFFRSSLCSSSFFFLPPPPRFYSLMSVFIEKKWEERSTTPVQSWHRGRGWPGGHWVAARRVYSLCIFVLW
jgi:hypothetical protein